MAHRCRTCRQDFPNEKKLERHLRHVHGGKNRDMRLRWAAAIGIAALAALAFIGFSDEPSAVEGRAANFDAFGLADDPYMGDPDAPVVLVGFESPNCSSCQLFHRSVLPDVQELTASGDVVYYYVEASIGNDWQPRIAQECAYRHGGNDGFWNLTDALYARENTFAPTDFAGMLRDLAHQQGLDEEVLERCYEEQETARLVGDDGDVARTHGVRATPTFFAFGPEGEAVQIPSMRQVVPWLQEIGL